MPLPVLVGNGSAKARVRSGGIASAMPPERPQIKPKRRLLSNSVELLSQSGTDGVPVAGAVGCQVGHRLLFQRARP